MVGRVVQVGGWAGAWVGGWLRGWHFSWAIGGAVGALMHVGAAGGCCGMGARGPLLRTCCASSLRHTAVCCCGCLQGMDVVQAIAALPRVKDNTNSPFFQAGKAAGGWVGGQACAGGIVCAGPAAALPEPGALLPFLWTPQGVHTHKPQPPSGPQWPPLAPTPPPQPPRLQSAAAGDKRADVAQRAFNKPFAKIRVDECGYVTN